MPADNKRFGEIGV